MSLFSLPNIWGPIWAGYRRDPVSRLGQERSRKSTRPRCPKCGGRAKRLRIRDGVKVKRFACRSCE